MRKLISLAIVAFVSVAVLVGCAQDVSVIQPIVGTWQNDKVLGSYTTIVLNNDASTTQTITVLGVVGITSNGTWTSNDTTITRTWSDGSTDVKYYTFADSNKQMTLSDSVGGAAITYTRQ